MSAAEDRGAAALWKLSAADINEADEPTATVGKPPTPAAADVNEGGLTAPASSILHKTSGLKLSALPHISDFKTYNVGRTLAIMPSKTLVHALMRKNWEAAEAMVTPEAAKQKDIMGRVPLCTAISYKAPEKLLASIISANPGAVRENDSFGDLPLQVALKHGLVRPLAPHVPAQILAAYPEAAKLPDRFGDLPLNYVLEHGANSHLVAQLLDLYPAAARETNKNGMGYLPLQVALRAKASHTVIQRVLEAYPQAAGEKDVFGYLPLQVAVREYANSAPKLVELLAKHTPEELREEASEPQGIAALLPSAGVQPISAEALASLQAMDAAKLPPRDARGSSSILREGEAEKPAAAETTVATRVVYQSLPPPKLGGLEDMLAQLKADMSSDGSAVLGVPED